MKRASLILLTFLYLFASVGVSAKSMYCLGMLKSTSVSYLAMPKSSACKMAGAKTKKCCKTKKQYFKVGDKHFYSSAINLPAKLFPLADGLISSQSSTCASTALYYQAYYSNAPPLYARVPVYVLNCNFRI